MHESLLVFPEKLRYNEGIVHNFSDYEGVYICPGNPDKIDLDKIEASSLQQLPPSYYIFSSFDKTHYFLSDFAIKNFTIPLSH